MRNFTFILFFISYQVVISQTLICPENKKVEVLIDKAIALKKVVV